MAQPFSVTPNIGADFVTITRAADIAEGTPGNCRLGEQRWGSDGRLYVYGQANASIAASTAVCTVNATTFLVTATAGSYRSPAFAMVAGDRAWFSKASV